MGYYFLNDAGLREHDEDEAVEIEELKYKEKSNGSKHMSGTEPSQMKHLMQSYTSLDQ